MHCHINHVVQLISRVQIDSNWNFWNEQSYTVYRNRYVSELIAFYYRARSNRWRIKNRSKPSICRRQAKRHFSLVRSSGFGALR